MWNLTPFNIVPSLCEVRYKCIDVSHTDNVLNSMKCRDFVFDGIFDGEGTDGRLTITIPETYYTNGQYPPGTYKITIEGTTVKAETPRTATVEFTLILNDICNPPNDLSNLENISNV